MSQNLYFVNVNGHNSKSIVIVSLGGVGGVSRNTRHVQLVYGVTNEPQCIPPPPPP